MNEYPLPWDVAYDRKFPEWHKKAMPHVIDAQGKLVLTPVRHVSHPGQEDPKAEALCDAVVEAVNAKGRKPCKT